MVNTCFMFDLEQLAQVGCRVTITEDGLLSMARIELPDGGVITSSTGGKKVILPWSWHEEVRGFVNRLVAIGAEPVEIEDIPFLRSDSPWVAEVAKIGICPASRASLTK